MWKACRVAALQRLRVSAPPSSVSQLQTAAVGPFRQSPVTSAAISHFWPNARFASTTARTLPLDVCGVALHDLAKRPSRDLQSEFGADVLRAVRRSLPQLWDELLKEHVADGDESPPVSRDVAKQIFQAAHQQQLTDLALRVFEYMDAAFPAQVDFVVYGEVFTMLARLGKADETLAVFERNKHLYSEDRPAPELIYRFGLFGMMGKRDFAGVDGLLEEMERYGIPLTNELRSRIMIAYAKTGNSEKVMEIYQTLEPHAGRWHEADVDRVINSMGLIRCADEAFEFYRNARIKLSGNTIVALLNVCRKTNRPKHAMAILENRKRFNLVLNTREYNKVLEALEAFEEFAQIAPLLDEMKANGARFDKLTNAIIARNQQCLHGTPYERAVPEAKQPGPTDGLESGVADLHLSEHKKSKRKIRDLNNAQKFEAAAALADTYIAPLEGDENLGVLTIPGPLSAEAVVAYAKNGEHDKVKALVKGFGRAKGNFHKALTSVRSIYAGSDTALEYDTFRASLFQDSVIFRVNDALERFKEFKDPESTIALFRQAFVRIVATLEENGRDFLKLKKTLQFERMHVVRTTLQILIENQKIEYVLEVLDILDASGFPVRVGDYTTIVRLMREQGAGVYSADAFDQIWEDMLTKRDIVPVKAIVANSCAALAGGSADQHDRLLKAYAIAKENPDDQYVLVPVCYSALLAAAVKSGTLSDVQALYDDAMHSHAKADPATSNIRYFRWDWESALVRKLATSGAAPEVVFQRVKEMEQRGDGYALEAVLSVLRVCVLADNRELVAQLREIFTHRAKFRLSVGNGERLMRTATSHQSLPLAMLTIELLEESNLIRSASSPSASGASEPRSTENVEREGDEAAHPAIATGAIPFKLEKKPTAQLSKNILALYDAALALGEAQEPEGANTAFLRARRAEVAAHLVSGQ
ncbi:hypothetical protein PybrP1_007235 [[Pythium] brassicae (nom. inval.)]|nr:hypothetical protein PybrP1_007235 [[Pythium] brassicae (nom. inval.)]